MKQARRGLLLAAALVLLPQAAHAQKKKPSKGGDTAAAPVDMDADQQANPPASPSTPPAGGETTTPSPEGLGTPPATGGVDICQITPDADVCKAQKEINLAQEAKKTIRAEVYAVQQQYVIKAQRFEIMPYFEFTLNDQFVSHDAPGLALNYYITQVLAVGVNANWYDGLNADSDFNFQNRRAARIAVPLNDYQLSADLNFTYVPMYGKFAGFGDFIFHYDVYVDGGVGLIRTKPIPIIDPDNRSFPDWNNLVNFDVGIGFRIFFNRWLSAVLEVRDLIYSEKIESLTINAADPTNKAFWYDNGTHITNDVQMQVGLSFLLPTSFEYRLPK
ncbi:MAG TPA: outer membrane beta-barrel domain-containing protein [Polyangiaceae bacterium]|nr:outer membrane beta-barrel domain-containing protein [Polyangiaceae bacterium]